MTRTAGLNFQKFDLHVHTPASGDFRNKNITPEEIVETALSKGLKAIAITDHHSGEWIDRVKEAAKGSGLTVFPGIEITVIGGENGIHIIGLFDVNKTTRDLESFLGGIDIRPENQGKTNVVVTEASIEKVINKINEHNGLAVLAHANSSKGVISEIKGTSRTAIFRNSDLLAVEVTEADFKDEKKGRATRAIDLLDGKHADYCNRKLGVYQASDNPCELDNGELADHCLEGIGRRYTYFNVDDSITLESLRQCFIDPDTRIRQRQDIESEVRKAQSRFPFIKEVRVTGGFLDNAEVIFHSGLNTIIGGKGSGKSLLIEFIRFVLNQESTQEQIEKDHNGKLEKRLMQFGAVTIVFVDEAGTEHEITRKYDPTEGNPYSKDHTPDPGQAYPVLFLSQNEIIRIAESEAEQIKFIDSFFDFRSFQKRIGDHEAKIRDMDKNFASCLDAIHKAREFGQQSKTLTDQITKINEKLKSDIFERFEKSQKKYLALTTQLEYLGELKALLIEFSKEAEEKTPIDADEVVAEDPAVKRVISISIQAQMIIENDLSATLAKIEEKINKAQGEIAIYKPSYEKEKKAYEGEILKSGGDDKALSAQRERLVKELKDIDRKYSAYKSLAEKIRKVKEEREQLLNVLASIYSEYSSQRKQKCEEFESFSKGRVKATLNELSDVTEFRSRLDNLKRGSYLTAQEIEAISKKIKPRDFVLNLMRYDSTAGETKDSHLKVISDSVGLNLARIKTLADFLINEYEYTDLLSLEHQAMPKDRPVIKVNVGDDQYELLSDVSTGQKCTAMLVMALCEGTMPIVVDQPEDSLDIKSIWEDMCSKLRAEKEGRQFIFTTHNSSLAVASDTDKYLILEATATSGEVVHCGAIDSEEIKEEIIKYLEGGTDAYRIKFKKYNIGKRLSG